MALVDPCFPDDLVLHSPGVKLGLVALEDAPEVHRVLSDPGTMDHLTYLLLPPGAAGVEKARERCRLQNEVWRDRRSMPFTVRSSQDGSVLGTCGLNRFSRAARLADFGIILDRRAWGRGVSAACHLLVLGYAFEKLNMHRVEFETSSLNTRMQRFYEKAGITFDGRKRDGHRHGEGFVDAFIYGVLEHEWPSVREKLVVLSNRG